MSIEFREDVPAGPVRQFDLQTDEPSLGAAFGAAFRVENSLGSFLAREPSVQFEPRANYDAFDDIVGYEDFADSFIDARTPVDTARVKRQIDREQEDRQTIAAAGGWGMFAAMTAGTLDPLFLPLMLIPGGQVIKGASATKSAVVAAGAGTTIAETALHASQETRTATESAFAVGATVLVSGALGEAASLLSRSDIDRLNIATARELAGDVAPSSSSVGARAVRDSTLADETLVGAFGSEKVLARMSPLGRLMNSPAKAARQLAEDLAETPFLTRKNLEGTPTPVAVETLVKRHEAGLAGSIDELDNLYVQYRTGQAGTRASRVKVQARDLVTRGRGERLSFSQFRHEVGGALRRGDRHAIPEVAAAAKRFRAEVFDPLKQRAIELGLLAADVKVVGADSYFTRVYRTDKIKANPNKFRDILSTWFQKSWRLEKIDADEIAVDVMGNIMASPQGRIERQLISEKVAALMADKIPDAPTAAPLRQRVVPVPDELLEEFLESDIETVASFYVRTMAPEIELHERFGDKSLAGAIQGVKDEYAIALGRTKDSKSQSKLLARQEADLRDLVAMRDRLIGIYDAPKDPSHWAVRASRVLREQNYIGLLGSQMLSSIPDLAMPVMRHGFRRYAKSMAHVIRAGAEWQGTKKELKQIGIALDMTLNTRAKSIGEIADIPYWGNRVEAASHGLAQNFTLTSLMAPWNAAMKQLSAYTGIQAILEGSERWVKGTLPSNRRAVLANLGIGEPMARRIHQQFAKHGTKGDLWDPNWKAWDDLEARRMFEAAVLKEADTAIVTPGIGDRPLLMSTEVGKVIGQFKTFALAANNRVLIAGLQRKDAEFVSGLLAAITLGGLSYAIRQATAGREISTDPAVLFTEAVDRSGVTGILFDVNNMAEKLTRGSVGVSRLTGGPLMSRYESRNVSGALLGPSLGRVEDIVQVSGAMATGEIKESDVRAMRQLMPYQNLFYIRQLLNQLEAGIAEEVVSE